MKRYLTIFALLLILTSCRVTLTPTHSGQAIEWVNSGYNSTDNLYDELINGNDKAYDTHEDQYASIQKDIDSLSVLYSKMNKAGKLSTILGYIKGRFKEYRSIHEESKVLNNSTFIIYKDGMDVLWKSLKRAQESL